MVRGESRRAVLGALGAIPVAAALPAAVLAGRSAYAGEVPGAGGFDARVREIVGRAAFAGATWGMSFLGADTGRRLYTMLPDDLFLAASAMKIFIGGTAFEALGPDHRFRTRVRAAGPVVRGVLRGDLVLVAGGDLLLSGRTRPDGTLALPDPDHTYPGGPPLPGDPLAQLRRLAAQVRAAGVHRVEGRVRVDATLFREGRESVALGDTTVTVSPMMVYDNVVNVVVTPGATPGADAAVQAVPDGYLRLVNQAATVATPAVAPALTAATTQPDGTRTVTVTGEVAAGGAEQYLVDFGVDPDAYASAALTAALAERGVEVRGGVVGDDSGTGNAGGAPGAGRQLAELVSAPLSIQSQVMLKVSSNLHTVAWPYLVGAIAGHDPEDPKAAYARCQQRLFEAAGLDAVPAGSADGQYSATTFVRFLAYLRHRPYFAQLRDALPVMGRDGTLAANQTTSPAAGHVYAKTGTGAARAGTSAVLHKALAGYLQFPDRSWVAFAQFMRVPVATIADAAALGGVVQEAMAEIATAAYEMLGGAR
jgi:PBP4 family serine-type D-alanyl-D-alanine carboxypeptidase